ncbi:MAG: signal peptidase I [Enhygromyxa sp.]
MTDAEEVSLERSTASAVAWDFVIPGLGRWYLGAAEQAVVLAVLYLLAVPGLVVMIAALDRGLGLAAWSLALGGWLLRLLAVVYALIDRHRRGARIEPSRATTAAGCVAFAVVALGVNHLARTLLYEHVLVSATVPADSGRPQLDAGDRIIVTKLRARDREARRGDLITFPVPGQDAVFVKRVVGLAGETVALTGGVVSIDGVVFATSPCESEQGADETTCRIEHMPEGARYRIELRDFGRGDFAATEVPAGHVFVVGDARFASFDSREFGAIPVDSVLGRVRAIWWPLDRASSLDPQPSLR